MAVKIRLKYCDACACKPAVPGTYHLSSINASASTVLTELEHGPLAFAARVDYAAKKWMLVLRLKLLSGTELRPAINLVKGEREIKAAFAEFSIPLLQDLTASVAGRSDHYDDFGNAFSPKVGVHYVLAEDWLVRASWSKGFRAPVFA